jgi:signal transduction histidine kinase
MASQIFPFRIGLRAKLMSLTAFLLSLVVVLIILLVSRRIKHVIVDESHSRGVAIAQLFGATNVNYLKSYHLLPIQQNAMIAKEENQLAYLIVYDKEGRIVANTADAGAVLSFSTDQDANALLSSGQVLFREKASARSPSKVDERLFEIFLPVTAPESSKRWGTIQLGISTRPMEKALRETQFHLVLLGAFCLALGSIGAASLAARITTPIQQLAKASLQAARGDLSVRLRVRSGDEIESLAGNFNYMIEQIRDHQDARVKAEKAEAIGNLVNTIVHDCRTPLTVIKGFSSYLNELDTPPKNLKECLQLIQCEVERLERMVDEILDFPSAGRSFLILERINLDEFVSECCIEIQALLQRSEVSLAQELKSNAQVLVDKNQMRRALLNLVANAQDAIHGPGIIRISTEVIDFQSILRIADNGGGIPLELQPKLFEPFFTHGKTRGHGLGMSITKRIIEDHSRNISFESIPGRGTIFTIALPVAANSKKRSAAV